MSTVLSENKVRLSFRPSFFFWVALIMAFFVYGGFTLAAIERTVTGNTIPMPPVVHVHGVVFICWISLLVIQSFLINVRNIALHRTLGSFGIGLGTAVLFTGALISVLGLPQSILAQGPFFFDLTYLSFMALLGFTILFILAMRTTRNPEFHRRFILFATIPLLPPGINRMYQVVMQLDFLPVIATYLTMSALACAFLIYDWRTMGKISKASIIGTTVVVAQQVLHFPITRSEAFADFVQLVSSLIYYR